MNEIQNTNRAAEQIEHHTDMSEKKECTGKESSDNSTDCINEKNVLENMDDMTQTDTCKKKVLRIMKENMLLLLTLCGVLLGFVLGLALRETKISDSAILWLGMPGEIFIRSIYFTILPLLVSSLITGTSSLDGKTSGKIGLAAILYFVTVNTIGVFIALGFFYIMDPAGNALGDDNESQGDDKDTRLEPEDIFADLLRNLVPDNMISAGIMKTQTFYDRSEKLVRNSTGNYTMIVYEKRIGTASSPNLLGIIVASSVIGYATGQKGEVGQPIVAFFKGLTEVIIYVMNAITYLTPVGVLSMIATAVAQVDDIGTVFKSFGMYATTTIIFALFVPFIVVPGCYLMIFRENPIKFILLQLKPMLDGFAPPSSAMSIPGVLHVAENEYNVDSRISRFCVLFGAAICRCGSAGFIVICSLFLASLETGHFIEFGQVLQVIVLSISGSLAIPAVPSSSVVCVLIILSSIGIKPSTLGMVIALEWLLDRIRTLANVSCNLFGALLINKIYLTGLTKNSVKVEDQDL